MSRPPVLLVVEDEPRNQALIRAVFAGAAYDLAMVATVAEARGWLAEHTPDLVLLDLRLPDGPGTVLARELRADANAADIPILVVTASVLDADRTLAAEAGADGFVEKPISPRALLSMVRSHLTRTPA